MTESTYSDLMAAGETALADGRWLDARSAFEAAIAAWETADACFGSAVALWWLGESHAAVERCERAYALYRRSADRERAAHCAVWLALTYKANFANFPAANGWIGRAERLLGTAEPGPAHGWVWIARAYKLDDLAAAEELAQRAVDLARCADDIDLELVALAQLGLVRVGQGDTAGGFALIDEAMAAALAGERTTLDTVVYTSCDMLNACELTSDLERAAQWCRVADAFVESYGCPFLYAECRIHYGSVLAARGQWADAEHELVAGLRITDRACPALHTKAIVRIAALRIRQGRLEEAGALLADIDDALDADAEQVLAVAALLLARGDATAAADTLGRRMRRLEKHRLDQSAALDLLVEACLAAGDLEAADSAASRLAALSEPMGSDRMQALAVRARGRAAAAHGAIEDAVDALQNALTLFVRLELPLEAARTRGDLALLLAESQREQAVEHARRALAAFEDLGASIDADRTAALLRSLGVSSRTGHRSRTPLTDREREVLVLLGAGLSNPEIADRLHVSRKTASHHVSNILAKLNLRNRVEAAAHAVRANADTSGSPTGR